MASSVKTLAPGTAVFRMNPRSVSALVSSTTLAETILVFLILGPHYQRSCQSIPYPQALARLDLGMFFRLASRSRSHPLSMGPFIEGGSSKEPLTDSLEHIPGRGLGNSQLPMEFHAEETPFKD